jgi:hypothetical protein
MMQKGRQRHSIAELRGIHAAIKDGEADEAEVLCIVHVDRLEG